MSEKNKNIESRGFKKLSIIFTVSMLIYAVIWSFISLITNISNTYPLEFRGIGVLEIGRWIDVFIFPACMTIGYYLLMRLTAKLADWKWAAMEDLKTSSFTGLVVMFFLILCMTWFTRLYIPEIIAISAIVITICYAGYRYVFGEKGMGIGFSIGGIAGAGFASGIALGWLAGLIVIVIEAAVFILFANMIHLIEKEDKSN